MDYYEKERDELLLKLNFCDNYFADIDIPITYSYSKDYSTYEELLTVYKECIDIIRAQNAIEEYKIIIINIYLTIEWCIKKFFPTKIWVAGKIIADLGTIKDINSLAKRYKNDIKIIEEFIHFKKCDIPKGFNTAIIEFLKKIYDIALSLPDSYTLTDTENLFQSTKATFSSFADRICEESDLPENERQLFKLFMQGHDKQCNLF